MQHKDKKGKATNPDPITGAPGSHPVGTGVGAAAGGAAAYVCRGPVCSLPIVDPEALVAETAR